MPQDSEDAEQCEGVSQMVLPDIFVPVFETEDDSSKDSTFCEEVPFISFFKAGLVNRRGLVA